MKRPLTAALCLAVLVAAAFPAAAAPKPPNVILLIVDDLRADRLGAYGAGPAATPRFDALARESVVFDRAFAQAGWTLPSVSSIMTGLYPTVHGAYRALPGDWPARLGRGRLRLQPRNSLASSRLTLAAALRRRGYHTEAVVSCPFGDPVFGFGSGFDVYDHSGGFFPDVNAGVARRLEALRSGAPFFLYIHVVDAHVGGPEAAADVAAPAVRPDGADSASYDVQVSSVDAGLGVLLAALRDKGLLDGAIFILTADHGEEFGEHGETGHGSSPYDTALRVPLLIRLPGGKPSRRVGALAQTIDIFPTVLDLAGLPPEKGVEGETLRPEIEGASPARTVYSEIYPHTPPFNDSLLAVAVRTDDWKYVWRPDGADELYAIKKDPGERADAAAANADAAREFRRATGAWRERLLRAAASLPPIPGDERFLPPQEADRLRRAGYLK